MSDRRSIIEWVLERCQYIKQANGFNTDAGDQAFLGEVPSLGPDDDPQAIAILIGDDVPTMQDYGPDTIELQLPIDVQALTAADVPGGQPWLANEDLIADIKTAIESDIPTIPEPSPIRELTRGSTSTLEREEGSDVVGNSVAYIVTMAETWGAP